MALPFTTAMPGPYNVYIPAFQGKQTADLVVSYARDPRKFPVNRLVQRTPTKTLSGHWLTLRPEVLARILNDPNEAVWVDGQPRPRGTHNQQDFRAFPYICVRRCETAYLGWQTRDQAVWPIQDTQTGVLGHRMMTRRALAFYNVAMATGNHLASHVKTATQWSNIGGTGGFWTAGTTANPVIKRSLLQAAEAVRKDTLDAVQYTDLTLVITPPAAIAMSTSAEIHDYLAQSPLSLKQVRGEDETQNGQWGLPDKLYGMNLVVDGTLRTTSGRQTVPGSFLNVLKTDDNSALIMAAPGDLSGNTGQVTSAFSSYHMFIYNGEEMRTTTLDEPIDERTLMSVDETYDIKPVAPETTALITNLFS
jgi:hypothetical protein